MTSNHHGPYVLGYTRATMAGTTRCNTVTWSQSLESRSQFGLESETRLHEGGIASNRASAWRGEYVPGPCTHRPSHHPSGGYPKPFVQPARGDDVEGTSREEGEVVTR